MLVAAAMRVGFSGGLVVDYPHSTRAKKYFLVLMVGAGGYIPQGKDGDPDAESSDEEMAEALPGAVRVEGRGDARARRHGGGGHGKGGKRKGQQHGVTKDKGWVLKKKDKLRRKGHQVKPDTKYTARKRRRAI